MKNPWKLIIHEKPMTIDIPQKKTPWKLIIHEKPMTIDIRQKKTMKNRYHKKNKNIEIVGKEW